MGRRRFLGTAALAAASLGLPRLAFADEQRFIGVDELKIGMKGYGLTVMKGTKIERFTCEVIEVLQKALPAQDIVLIRCAGLNLEHSGIIAGMSGSPIYFDGRLAGALAYGWGFQKDPIAGVTPIADMVREMRRPLGPVLKPQKFQPLRTVQRELPGGLLPVAVPMSVSGLAPEIVAEMGSALRDAGFVPLQTTGGGTGTEKNPPFVGGAAVGVALMRGDAEATAIGTVTYVEGDRFAAFGHPFNGLGQIHMPVTGAAIRTVIAMQSSSMKLGVALDDVGVLEQDRQPCIAGRLGQKSRMVPITCTVKSRDTGASRSWTFRVNDHPMVLPLLAGMAVGNALGVSESLPEAATVDMRLEVRTPGREPVVLVERLTTTGGTLRMGEPRMLVMQVLSTLTQNGFERLDVDGVSCDFQVEQSRRIALIEGAWTDGEDVHVGERVSVRVLVVAADAKPERVTIDLPPIPEELEGQSLEIRIEPGSSVQSDLPQPASVDDVLRVVRARMPHNMLCASYRIGDPTLLMRGVRLRRLPGGLRDEIGGPATQTGSGEETVLVKKLTPWVLNGRKTIRVRVLPAR